MPEGDATGYCAWRPVRMRQESRSLHLFTASAVQTRGHKPAAREPDVALAPSVAVPCSFAF